MSKILKRPTYVILSLLIVAAIVKIIFLEDKIDNGVVEESLNITTSQPVEEYKYILKEFKGKLAVFEVDKKEPDMIFDVLIDSLPEVDIIELKQGLKIKDAQELNDRIEDFVS